jgi:heterodisulfide reductase subunit A-like polyferredoxin
LAVQGVHRQGFSAPARSLDLANAGHYVHLGEKKLAISGTMMHIDNQVVSRGKAGGQLHV